MDEMFLGVPSSVRDIVGFARDVSAKVKYPIEDFDQLAAALGGDQDKVSLLSESYTVSELRDITPKEYFPIESEEDLAMKVASGYFSKESNSDMVKLSGQKLDKPPEGVDPPPNDPPDTSSLRSSDLPQFIGNKRS